jgi:hypothetical protein
MADIPTPAPPDTSSHAAMMSDPRSPGSHEDHGQWLTEYHEKVVAGRVPATPTEPTEPRPKSVAAWFDAKVKPETLREKYLADERARATKDGRPAPGAPRSPADLPHDLWAQRGLDVPSMPGGEHWGQEEPSRTVLNDFTSFLQNENLDAATGSRILADWANFLTVGGFRDRSMVPAEVDRAAAEWTERLQSMHGLSERQAKQVVNGYRSWLEAFAE